MKIDQIVDECCKELDAEKVIAERPNAVRRVALKVFVAADTTIRNFLLENRQMEPTLVLERRHRLARELRDKVIGVNRRLNKKYSKTYLNEPFDSLFLENYDDVTQALAQIFAKKPKEPTHPRVLMELEFMKPILNKVRINELITACQRLDAMQDIKIHD